MKADDLLSREKVRGDSYKLLSECYLLPSGDLTKKLTDLEQLMNSIGAEVAKYVPGTNDDESLKIDYSKLFVGPYKLFAPPYGSIYLEGARRVMGNSTIDVRNRYREAGLDISENLKEAPDHIAVELEFMYFLIGKEIEAMENSNLESAMDYLKKQKEFLDDHLGVWVSEFTDNIEKNAETEFYRNLSRATKSFIKKDMTELTKKTS